MLCAASDWDYIRPEPADFRLSVEGVRADDRCSIEASRPRWTFAGAGIVSGAVGRIVPGIVCRVVYDREGKRPRRIAHGARDGAAERFTTGVGAIECTELLRAQDRRGEKLRESAGAIADNRHHAPHAEVALAGRFEHQA